MRCLSSRSDRNDELWHADCQSTEGNRSVDGMVLLFGELRQDPFSVVVLRVQVTGRAVIGMVKRYTVVMLRSH